MKEKIAKNSKENVASPMLVGIFLLSVLFFLVFITPVLFAFGIPVTVLHLPVAVLLAAAACYFLSGKSIKRTLIAVGAGLLIMCASGFVNCYIPDNTWDGNSYHKYMTGYLRYGWNPLRETFYDFESHAFPFFSSSYNVLDAYPKGSETIAACFYIFTGSIEIGKIFNLLSIAGAMCICAAYLMDAVRLRGWQSWICAAIFTIHPVSVSQAFCYYNDGFLWQMVLLCTAGCLYLLFFEEGRYRRISLFLVFAAISIGFNIKFSGVIFFALPCAGLFALWAIRLLWKNRTKKEFRMVVQGTCFFSVAVISGFVICGSTSYVVNTIRHHNPLYTIFGEGANEIIFANMPVELKGVDPEWRRVLVSLFSDYGANGIFGYKVPLLFSTASVNASAIDQRLGGWGILFSDLLVIGILVMAIVWLLNLKKRQLLCRVMEVFALLGLAAAIAVPGLWWARYFVAPLYIPASAVVVLFYVSNQGKRAFAPYASGCLAALCLVNTVPNFAKNVEAFQRYTITSCEWDRMRAISTREPLNVSFTMPSGYGFSGRLFNLMDNGITNYQYVGKYSEGMRTVYPNYPVYYTLPDHGVWAADDLVSYVEQAQEMNDVALLISVKDEASNGLTDEMIQAMQSLGLQFDMKGRYRESYLAVVENGDVLHEEASSGQISYAFDIGQTSIAIMSAGYLCGNRASICVNGIEYAANGRGINIVLVDTKTGGVLDSVVFDTFDAGACVHK